jgi:imidazolonepropionase-like amidohydrolase
MRKLRGPLACLALLSLAVALNPLHVVAQTAPAASARRVLELVNGQWYDGKGFKRSTFYSIDGVLTSRAPARVDETVDLANGYVIPPFGDAHTHNLDGTYGLDKMVETYLNEGTFYVQVLCNYATGARQARPMLNRPTSVDVVYANGGLTSTLGHPFLAYEPRALGFWNPAEWEANMEKIKLGRKGERDVYWFLDSIADVDAQWPAFVAQKPDVVKILLLDAKNHEQLAKNGKVGDKGLSPEVAAYVVRKAHGAGLRVYAHIETADDFRLGLRIGVDGFAHAPHYGWNGSETSRPANDLTAADVRLAARKRVVVIPTAQLGKLEAGTGETDEERRIATERLRQIVERQRRLLGLMLRSGVTLALGSDYYGQSLGGELWYLHDNRILDNATLLRTAVETTPRVIFRGRKIGRLADGYEASFLVLDGNPIERFEHVKSIRLRFKQGVRL